MLAHSVVHLLCPLHILFSDMLLYDSNFTAFCNFIESQSWSLSPSYHDPRRASGPTLTWATRTHVTATPVQPGRSRVSRLESKSSTLSYRLQRIRCYTITTLGRYERMTKPKERKHAWCRATKVTKEAGEEHILGKHKLSKVRYTRNQKRKGRRVYRESNQGSWREMVRIPHWRTKAKSKQIEATNKSERPVWQRVKQAPFPKSR